MSLYRYKVQFFFSASSSGALIILPRRAKTVDLSAWRSSYSATFFLSFSLARSRVFVYNQNFMLGVYKLPMNFKPTTRKKGLCYLRGCVCVSIKTVAFEGVRDSRAVCGFVKTSIFCPFLPYNKLRYTPKTTTIFFLPGMREKKADV